jgi:hypothetical protein
MRRSYGGGTFPLHVFFKSVSFLRKALDSSWLRAEEGLRITETRDGENQVAVRVRLEDATLRFCVGTL